MIFFAYFSIPSSSRHEKCCRILVRLFWLFQCSRNPQCETMFLWVFFTWSSVSSACFFDGIGPLAFLDKNRAPKKSINPIKLNSNKKNYEQKKHVWNSSSVISSCLTCQKDRRPNQGHSCTYWPDHFYNWKRQCSLFHLEMFRKA